MPTPVSTALCPTCSALSIKTILCEGLSSDKMIPFDSLTEILRRADRCHFCRLVTSLFLRRWCLDAFPQVDLTDVQCSLYAMSVGNLADPPLKEKKQCHRLFIDFSARPAEITDMLTLKQMDLSTQIQLLEEDAHKVGRTRDVHGRRMADMIDMGLVKKWISLCEREHGHACESVWWRDPETQLPPFVRMVDVSLMSVVCAPSDCRYLALSYVWGSAGDSYWTTKANVDSRGRPAALDLSTLPATIVDAVHVTKVLGERYLWIDALCIVQDSLEDKNDQINAMELIYSRALLTIVAAGGENVHANLPGVSAGSRHPNQHIEVVQDLHLAIPLPSLREATYESLWATRGWTFQELLLSRRRLFFTKHQAYFECTKDTWCEDLVAESKTAPFIHHPMRYLTSGARLFLPPQLSPTTDYLMIYGSFVERYTQRQLTYPSDIILAVTALTNAIMRAYRLAKKNAAHTFQYGMQIWDLNHSLLWQPRFDSVHARRLGAKPEMGVSAWPSWSWAGWTGAVYYCGPEQLKSSSDVTGTQGKPTETLVSSWYIINENQRVIHLEVEKISYVRIMDPGVEDTSHTRYLAMGGDIDEQLLTPCPPVGTLIFRTQCAFFKVARLQETLGDSKRLPYGLFDILSDVRRPSTGVGRIILPSSTPLSTMLEFIVLSRSFGISGLYDEGVYGSYRGCLLQVMAVKRRVEGDVRVRERVGLGIIFEQAWLEGNAKVDTVFLC